MRNTAVKLTAMLLFIACISTAVGVTLDTIAACGDEPVYRMEKSFEQSYAVRESLYNAVACINNGHDNVSLEERVNKIDDKAVDYYVEINGEGYSNCGQTEKEYYTNSECYAVFDKNQAESPQNIYLHSELSFDLGNDSKIYIKLRDDFAQTLESYWIGGQKTAKSIFVTDMILLMAALVMFAYLLYVCGRKKADEEIHLLLIDKMYVELTAGLAALVAVLTAASVLVMLEQWYSYSQLPTYAVISISVAITAISAFLLLNLILSLARNLKNKTFLAHSFIATVLKLVWRAFKIVCGYTAGKLVRLAGFIRYACSRKTAVQIFLLLFGYTFFVCVLSLFVPDGPVPLLFILLIFAGAWLYLIKRYKLFDELKKAVFRIKDGDVNYKIADTDGSTLGIICESINTIGEGMKKSVEGEIRSERMKSELITNVSHDLKTPLTSIITYTELLAKEELSPAEANDYVKIIMQKGQRLKNLTADLFEISKVQSGNEALVTEDINLSLLLGQVIGENDALIKQSGLDFKVSLDEDVHLTADGKKMARVFENLISNAVKYAMQGTRVYITLKKSEETVIEFKNIASYEMDFNSEDITERFARGDKSRTDEGSGLGLAIAKGYVEAFGGRLNVLVDGDLFKVEIKFR